MKTLLLAPELFTTDSGIPRILRLYLKALCELSPSPDAVRFVALNDSPRDLERLRPYFTPDVVRRWAACTRNKLRFLAATFRLSADVDLIVCGHVAQLPVAWLASRLRPGLRYALVAHGLEVWRPFSFAELLALKSAWRVFCVSEFTRTEVLRRAPVPSARAVVVPNALDPELASDSCVADSAAPRSPRVLLAVSRLSQADNYKGVDHLVAAMPAIRRAVPDAVLRIVGRGDDLPRLRSLAEAHGLGPAVVFTGYVDDQHLREEFATCAVFALPSAKEGFGLAYLEAMTHGKPCVAARAGGAPEVISPESGLLVPYGDVPALVDACVKALAGPWDADTIRACARRYSYPVFRANLQRLLAA